MIEAIKALDESLFLFLNAQHNSFFDPLMWLFSNLSFWTPLYIWFLWLLYKRYPKHYWTVIVAIAIMITVSDQLCNLSKESFMRLRPTHEPHLQAFIHTLNGYKGGMYSFYSGHAANTFTIAFFMIMALPLSRKYLLPITLAYAIITAYSRIYLGVHYPGDILTGACMGALVGSGIAFVHSKIRIKYLKLN